MRSLAVAVTVAVVAAGAVACAPASPAQSLCETTVAMATEVAEDGQPSQASVDAFVATAPDVRDPQLRDAAAQATAALTSDPASAIDPLAAVYDRCVELDHDDG